MLTKTFTKPSHQLLRSFGGGRAYDPNFERDWDSKSGQRIYKYFLRDHDVGEARKTPKSEYKMTVSKFLTTKLSNSQKSSLVKALYENWDNRKTERIAEHLYNPPKIHENSVLVYHGAMVSNMAVNVRHYDPYFLFLPHLLWPVSIPMAVGQFAMYMAYGRSLIYEPARRMVLRIDLLPHIESVSILRVGTFGGIYNDIIRCKDLEKVTREEDYDKANLMYDIQRQNIDWDMAFRNKVTGEKYLCEERGLWNWEGVNHPLIS